MLLSGDEVLFILGKIKSCRDPERQKMGAVDGKLNQRKMKKGPFHDFLWLDHCVSNQDVWKCTYLQIIIGCLLVCTICSSLCCTNVVVRIPSVPVIRVKPFPYVGMRWPLLSGGFSSSWGWTYLSRGHSPMTFSLRWRGNDTPSFEVKVDRLKRWGSNEVDTNTWMEWN